MGICDKSVREFIFSNKRDVICERLLVTRHQCRIHCKIRLGGLGPWRRDSRLQNTCDITKGLQSEHNLSFMNKKIGEKIDIPQSFLTV